MVKENKNFLPTLIITFFLWVAIAAIVYFVDPGTLFAVPMFFLLFFFASLFTLSIVLANSRLGFLISSGLTLFLILRFFGLGNWLNLVLLTGIIVTLEYYLSKK